MYRLMIIEDEYIEREGLKLMIKNTCTKISQIVDFINGIEAIENVKTYKPDIIIIDINMPGISGIDTIKEFRRMGIDAKILILSAYNNFEYAQQAMHLDVEEFLLKPIKRKEISQIINNVIDKIEQQRKEKENSSILEDKLEGIRPVIEKNIIKAITSSNITEAKELLDFLGYDFKCGFSIVIDRGLLTTITSSIVENTLKELGYHAIDSHLYDIMVFYIISCNSLDDNTAKNICKLIKSNLEKVDVGKVFIGVGTVQDTIKGLMESFNQGIMALTEGKNADIQLVSFHDLNNKQGTELDLSLWCSRFVTNIINSNYRELEEVKKEFMLELCNNTNLSIADKKEIIYKIIINIEKELSKEIIYFKPIYKEADILEGYLTISDIIDLRKYFDEAINKLIETLEKSQDSNDNSIGMKSIKYMEQNYNKPIGLEDIANEIGVTTFYISKIIKKHTGKNFKDYILELRINAAKELLQQGKMNIKEITYQVGFNSQHHFANTFKKYVGLTPTEFKGRYAVN